MEDHKDERDLIAPLSEVLPDLRNALARCDALGIAATVKYVPACQLGQWQDKLDNAQSDVIIVEDFWNEFPRFACLYQGICAHHPRCLGLHHDYVNKFGWEESVLVPAPRAPVAATSGAVQGAAADAGPPGSSAGPAALASNPSVQPLDGRSTLGTFPAWEALVAGLPERAGRLLGVELTRNEARLRFRLLRGALAEVLLTGRRDAPAFAKTKSFNLSYGRVEGEHQPVELKALLASVAALVERRDTGQLALDARKGLTEVRRPTR
jgi:hypothetical protein